MKKTPCRLVVLLGLSLTAVSARAQMGDPTKVTLKTTPVAGGISMIEGAVTFADDVTLHLNGDEVHVIHVAPAHTDGDSIVHFKTANVISTGDIVTASYPIIDVDSGGQFDGFIAATDRILALADDNTKIIP